MSAALLFAPALLAGPLAPAQDAGCANRRAPDSVRLQLSATGLRNADGEVAFSVYPDDAGRFLASRAYVARARVPARAPETRVCFWLPPGRYAAATYHDENRDRKFNRTLMVPREGFGFSNDASTSFGMPKFADVRFTLPREGRAMAIATRYRR